MHKNYLKLVLLLLLCSLSSVILWPNHDISTLKLLQVVHRHGDRTPIHFFPDDPFRNESQYWYEGYGELTLKGKYRMYKLGQYIRTNYNEYLGQNYSTREVYARSSLSHRCIQSVSCLLAGAYPPNAKQWQWNNGSDAELGLHWQPFPIETFMPQANDTLLDIDKECPNADIERNKIFNSEKVLNFLEENKLFLENLTDFVGLEVNSLKLANRLYEDLMIEYNRGYKWSDMKIWNADYEKLIFKKLLPIATFLWIVEWDNRLIERTRAGKLVNALVNNIEDVIDGKNDQNFKMFLYSTHDSDLAVLMHALNVYNNELIPFSASLLFELHQEKHTNDYFLRLYYYNETLTDLSPHLLTFPDCDQLTDCPIDKFLSFTKELIPEDWDKECGISSKKFDAFVVNIVILVINIVLVFVLVGLIVYNIYSAKNKYSYTHIAQTDPNTS